MTPEVSVLLPHRNVGGLLDEALACLFAQREVRIEVIAIDDGDGHEAVRAGTIGVKTGGVGIARALMAGLAVARAPIIARMDGDDLCHPERLAKQLEMLERDPGLAAVGTQIEAFPEGAIGDGMRRYVAWQNSLVTPEDHARQLFVESPLCHPSVVLRRDALERVGGWREGPWPEDYDLWLRLDAAGFRLAKVPELLFRWRHREGRATFTDPRYDLPRLRDAKAPFLAARLRQLARPLQFWGAGKTGKRLARALEPFGWRPELFVDVDPKKIGGTARAIRVVPPGAITPGTHTVVVATGGIGARDIVRGRLDAAGFVEGRDYLCAA